MHSYTRFGVLFLLLLAFVPATLHAQTQSVQPAPLLRAPTGTCPFLTDPSTGKIAVDETTGEAKHRECVQGICQGTNYPCNYSLQDIQDTAVGIVNWIFGIIGIVVLIMFIYGGSLWLLSNGNSSQVEKGRAVMVGSVIGILLIFSAGAIVKFFLRTLGGSGNTDVEKIINNLPLEGNAGDQSQNGGATNIPPSLKFVCTCTATVTPEAQQAMHFNCRDIAPTIANPSNCLSAYKTTIDAYFNGMLAGSVREDQSTIIVNAKNTAKNTAKCTVIQQNHCTP